MTLVEGHPLIERKTAHTHPNSHLCERKTTHAHPNSHLCERKTAHAARKRSKMSHFQLMWAKNISFSCRHLDILRSRGDQNFIPRLDTVSRHTSFRNNPLGKTRKPNDARSISEFSTDTKTNSVIHRHDSQACAVKDAPSTVEPGSSPVEWCNRFVSFGLGYAVSLSVVSSCWVGCGVSRDLVRMSRLR